MQRRTFLKLSTASLFLPCSQLSAQTPYPGRPIEIVIPLPPGGPTDTAPRIFIEYLRPLLKATFVPVNKPGAGGAIAADYVNRSTPDGYTILATSNPTLSVKVALDKNPLYKLEDFAPLGMYASDVGILAARRDLGIRTIDDLVARAQSSPDELNYASGGQGTVSHISIELFKSVSNVRILHVPFRGSLPAVQAILGGHVHLISSAYSAAAPLIESGSVIPLITTALHRLPELPSVPTLAERGLGDVALNIWMGFFVPVKTPQPMIRTFSDAIATVANDQNAAAAITKARMTAEYGDPARARALLEKERSIVGKLAQQIQLGE